MTSIHESYAERQRLAMAWDEWSDKIQHNAPEADGTPFGNQGCYTINHGGSSVNTSKGVPESALLYSLNAEGPEDNSIFIDNLYSHPEFRNQGVAEALFRRLNKDYPGRKINPGPMTGMGQEFHDRMLEKEPTARDLVSAAQRIIEAMAWQDWAPHIQHAYRKTISNNDNAFGTLFIDHSGEGKFNHIVNPMRRPGVKTYLNYLHHPDSKDIYIESIQTHPDFRRDGVQESLFRKLHETYPDHAIHPGMMTSDGRGFHDKMLQKEPTARDLVRSAHRLLQAMAWDEWAPKVKHQTLFPDVVDNYHSYYIDHGHPPAGQFDWPINTNHRSEISYEADHASKKLNVEVLNTHPDYRGRGVAEALMRKMHEDHPDYSIVPGQMTEQGQAFHDRMLQKEPDAKNIVAQANRLLLAMPWRTQHPDYQPADVAKNYNPDIGGTQGGGDSRNFLVGPKNNVWWHGSATGNIGGNESPIGFHIGDYQTAADALRGRVGRNPLHPQGRWDGKTSLQQAFPDSFKENGYPDHSWTHPDGTPMHGSYRPNVFPITVTGPMGNTTDNALSDGQAHALMRRQHTRPPKTPKGYYYINAGEGQGASPETGIVHSVSATVPTTDHVQKLDPAEHEHIAQQAHQNWYEWESRPRGPNFGPYQRVKGLYGEELQKEYKRQQQEQERRVMEWRNQKRTAAQAFGDCYHAALKYFMDNWDNPDVRMVHGEVAGQGPMEGKTFGHAWIEVHDPDNDEPMVIDPSNGGDLHMPISQYYSMGKINELDNYHSYTFPQAVEKATELQHSGPWDLTVNGEAPPGRMELDDSEECEECGDELDEDGDCFWGHDNNLRQSSKITAMAWWEMETKNKGYVKGRYYSEHNRSRDNLVKKLYGPGHTLPRLTAR